MYEDDLDEPGKPGVAIGVWNVGNADEVSTGASFSTPLGPLSEYYYHAVLVPPLVAIGGNKTYWLEIEQQGSQQAWVWESGQAGNMYAKQDLMDGQWVGTMFWDLSIVMLGEPMTDCNLNGVWDDEDIASGTSLDCNENAVPDTCETTTADFNADGMINASDLALLLGNWGACDGCCPTDLNQNATTDAADLALLLGSWGPA